MKRNPMTKPIYWARTSVEDQEKALFISKALVESHAAVSVHIVEAITTFAWEGSVDAMNEFEITIICSDPAKVKRIIDNYHTYKLPEFIYIELNSSEEINKWCTDWCSKLPKTKKL